MATHYWRDLEQTKSREVDERFKRALDRACFADSHLEQLVADAACADNPRQAIARVLDEAGVKE